MRNAILFIIFLIFSFFINVVFYYTSYDYRLFLKEIKDRYDTHKIEENDILDDNHLVENNYIGLIKPNNQNQDIFNKIENNKVEIKNWISLWKNYLEILDLFSNNNFQELELNTNLFDITNEYPDNYLEYYSRDLTLYFFPTKSYKDIYNIFSVLEYELPFKINETNTFWDKSFFINLNQDLDDNFIRIVISNKWIVFWLKIKKNEYNTIKEKLNILRNN